MFNLNFEIFTKGGEVERDFHLGLASKMRTHCVDDVI